MIPAQVSSVHTARRDTKERTEATSAMLRQQGVETLVLASNGLHLIDVPNPLAHLTGFRSRGVALAVLSADGCKLLVTPDEAADSLPDGAVMSTDLPAALAALVQQGGPLAWVGLDALPHEAAAALVSATQRHPVMLDGFFDAATGWKTARELDAARRATVIAEQGFEQMLALARPGMRECDLAVAVNLAMRALGAADSFTMLCASPHNPAVMPSSERPLQRGDVILVELSPVVDGQFVQICRTATIGPAPAGMQQAYQLLVDAMQEGFEAARPGVPVSAICDAIDGRMAAAGYAEFSRPPHLRRRGHGLGGGSIFPGDVAFDNPALLAPDMFFVVHPNQFLPGAGYMMCGEPLLITATGHEVLSRTQAHLHQIDA